MLINGANELGVALSGEKAQKMLEFMRLVLKKNETLNLTSITDEREFVAKHILDSLSIIPKLPAFGKLVDVGTGAGFPGVPLALYFDRAHIVLMDATKKKLDFLEKVLPEIGVKNCQTLWARAEQIGHHGKYREKFDVCTARAVAKTSVLCEYCLPLLRIGGTAVLMKGAPDISMEIEGARKAINLLGGEIKEICSLNVSYGKRVLIVIKKVRQTAANFPRSYAQISKTEIK